MMCVGTKTAGAGNDIHYKSHSDIVTIIYHAQIMVNVQLIHTV